MKSELRARRWLLIQGGTAAAMLLLSPAAARAQSADAAAAFIRQTGDALAAVANGSGADAQRKAELAAIVERTVDVDAIARFCLGRFWRMATPAQQQEYTTLFHRVLATNITGHLGDYRGVGFTLGRTVPRDGGFAVSSVITRPGSAPANVDWVVGPDAPPRIVDVIAEGTSLRLTQRSDYASFLSRNGNSVQALIDAMRRQIGA